ncbi:MAG: hypothetical protein K2L73_06690, partial [Muribaculaceae bacterium]|nr:hypothetical protein [Muribaculaceae bacterium]
MAISLKIKGNKRTNEGIGNDLVSIGDNRFPVTDAQYPGTKGVNDFIVIRHLPDKSIYTVVTKNVTPCDSNREGTLYVSVAVPVKEHVEGLFNLLIELQNAYKSSCMTYDGTMYHFLARNDMPQPFEEIIARHKVTRYPFKPVVTADDLSAKAYLFMSPEQISDLLDDPMRGEFSRFGEVVLVPVADPTQYVSTINIPAKIWRSYKIFVNGRQTGQVLSDPAKVVTITLPETSTHKSVSATFSIAQARDTRMPGIAIDDEAQIIYLNMKPEVKPAHIPARPDHDGLPEKKSGNKKTLIVAVITGLAVLAIAAAVYFLFLAPSDKKADDTQKGNGTEQIFGADDNGNIGDNDGLSDDEIPEDDSEEEIEAIEDPIDETVGQIDKKTEEPNKVTDNKNVKKEDVKQNLKNQFEADIKTIDEAEKHKFSELKELIK